MAKKNINSIGGFISAADFSKLSGDRTASAAAKLTLEIGQAVQGVKYLGARTVEIDGDDVTVHDGELEGAKVGLPLAASFNRQLEELSVQKGDILAILREPDAVKKKGKGKGNKMRVFRIVVQSRAK